ncbi:MAG: hypothetical protein M3Z16_12360 [Pseudomonadota bacterium]|nr:hypothetical protein [Pseudomonadota bacterium]
MNARLKQLRDLVRRLDRRDARIDADDADAYRSDAGQALKLTHEEMGLFPIGDFAGPVNALQTLAENIFFSRHGCFADLDGSGRAGAALLASKALLQRLQTSSPGAGAEITESLVARLRIGAR